VQSRVEGELASFSPDLLHVMHVHQLGALEAGGIPSVVSCHGLELNQSELVRRSLQRANAVHCNSRFTREYLRSLQPGTQEPQVLRWGVRGGSPTGSREAPEFDLVTVSRLVPRKNIESVLRALRRRPELRYAVIGDGPERELLEARASEWKLSGVEFLGELPESEKVSVLRRSRVFVLAPRADLRGDVEGLGLVYYEAFAAGLPVLAARSGGVPEAVGEAGVLVEDPLSVEELEHAMEALLDPAASEHWRERVRDHARGHPWEQFLTEFESFYLRVMDRARSDSR